MFSTAHSRSSQSASNSVRPLEASVPLALSIPSAFSLSSVQADALHGGLSGLFSTEVCESPFHSNLDAKGSQSLLRGPTRGIVQIQTRLEQLQCASVCHSRAEYLPACSETLEQIGSSIPPRELP